MATARGKRVGVRTTSRNAVVEEIIPNSGWTEDPTGHYLLVDLPDFRKEEVNLKVDSSGSIIVRGERKVNEWKSVHFQLTFPVPEDSDADTVAGKFDAGILYLNVPKRIAKENKESEIQEAPNGNVVRAEEYENQELNKGRDPSQHDSQRENEVQRNENAHIGDYSEQLIRKWEQEPMLRIALKVLRKNKGIVITAVIAFSLGILVSRTSTTTPNANQEERSDTQSASVQRNQGESFVNQATSRRPNASIAGEPGIRVVPIRTMVAAVPGPVGRLPSEQSGNSMGFYYPVLGRLQPVSSRHANSEQGSQPSQHRAAQQSTLESTLQRQSMVDT